MVQTKIASLLRSYKAAVDNELVTGAAPCVAPFMELMGDLFGNRPIIGNSHTINMHGKKTMALQIPVNINVIESEKDVSEASLNGFSENNEPTFALNKPAAESTPKKTAASFRRKKSTKEIIFDKRLGWEREKLKRKEDLILRIDAERQKRHDQTQEKLGLLIEHLKK